MPVAENSKDASISCPACPGNSTLFKTAKTHKAKHNSVVYTLYVCRSCDLHFWTPLKADPSVYEGEGFEAYKDYHAGTRAFPRWSLPLFQALPPARGRVLDIGCGDGSVLNRLSMSGYESYGIDLDHKSIEVAKEKHGLKNVFTCTLDDYSVQCANQALTFDLITFFEVLEHQDSPRAFLQSVIRLGKPGATVAGSVPNRNRFLGKLDRRLGEGDLPPHHFLWFSQRSLAALLEGAGLKNVVVQRTGALSFAKIEEKLCNLFSRKSGRSPGRALKMTVKLLAGIPWIGLRLAPSHLYFKGEIG